MAGMVTGERMSANAVAKIDEKKRRDMNCLVRTTNLLRPGGEFGPGQGPEI
jgi:hypothetical protein